MIVGWVGFVIDLAIQWLLDADRRHFAAPALVRDPRRADPDLPRVLRLLHLHPARPRRTRLQSKIQYYAAYLTILVITFGAVLVLEAERNYPGSNIKTYGEAVWWACVTVTTVGYGDYTPVSPTGRAIATLMLFNGVAIISVITATISSRFVSNPGEGELPVTLDLVDERLQRIEAALEALAAHGVRPPDLADQATTHRYTPPPDACLSAASGGVRPSTGLRGWAAHRPRLRAMFTDVARVVRASALADSELEADGLDPAQVVAGRPEVRSLALHDGDDLAVGVWQHSVGTSTDVEADEIFVVLSGRATVEVVDGPRSRSGRATSACCRRARAPPGRSTRPSARSTSWPLARLRRP